MFLVSLNSFALQTEIPFKNTKSGMKRTSGICIFITQYGVYLSAGAAADTVIYIISDNLKKNTQIKSIPTKIESIPLIFAEVQLEFLFIMESNSLGILEISAFNCSLVLNKEIYPLLKQNTAIIIMAPSFNNVYITTNENLCQTSHAKSAPCLQDNQLCFSSTSILSLCKLRFRLKIQNPG